MAKRRYIPPLRWCQDCGITYRSWKAIRCPGCGKEVMRDFPVGWTREARAAQNAASLAEAPLPEYEVCPDCGVANFGNVNCDRCWAVISGSNDAV